MDDISLFSGNLPIFLVSFKQIYKPKFYLRGGNVKPTERQKNVL